MLESPPLDSPLRAGSMSVKQAREFSGLSQTRLYELMQSGRIEWFNIDGPGSTRLIVKASLVSWLETKLAETKDRLAKQGV